MTRATGEVERTLARAARSLLPSMRASSALDKVPAHLGAIGLTAAGRCGILLPGSFGRAEFLEGTRPAFRSAPSLVGGCLAATGLMDDAIRCGAAAPLRFRRAGLDRGGRISHGGSAAIRRRGPMISAPLGAAAIASVDFNSLVDWFFRAVAEFLG